MTAAHSPLFTAINFIFDHWEVIGPDEDALAAARSELGIAVLFSAHELNPLLGALDRVLYLGNGHAALGTVDEVITGPVLSELYGSEIDVVRLKDRIFIMSGSHDVERDAHQHDHAHSYQSTPR